MEQPQIQVEDAFEKPKPTSRRGRPKKQAVTGEHVEALTVQIFGLTAMLRNRPYWVADPNEIKPWEDSAAELINEHLPKDYVERAMSFNAAIAVTIGLSVMVIRRLQADAEYDRQRLEMLRYQQAEEAKRTHPQEPRRPTAMNENPTPIRRNPQPSAGGAAPTQPEAPLFGNDATMGGLT